MRLTIYENLKRSVAHAVKFFKVNVAPALTGRPRKIEKQNALTLALYQHASSRATKKSVYEDFKKVLKCSYKTLVCALNEAGAVAHDLFSRIMQMNRLFAHPVKYTDATDLPVCLKKNADKHRVMAGLAGFGYSSKGWFYGLKLTYTRDHDGRPLAARITSPSVSDREIFKSLNKDLYGLLVADAGYTSRKLEKEMHIEGKRWVMTRPLKSMRRLATLAQLNLYKGRFQIELDFRSLKLFFGLVTSLPRSVNGHLANYLHALLAFTLR